MNKPQWKYKKSNNILIEGYYGFIYKLTYRYNNIIYYYYGMKSFYSYQTLPALKDGSQRPNSKRIGKNVNGKRKYFDIVSKESKWRTYESSSKDIPKEAELVSKDILQLARTKRQLTYLEAKLLFTECVLERDDCFNANILGKFFKGNI